jgi:hypothetical protein
MIADHNLVKKSFGLMIADHDLVCSVDEKIYLYIFRVYHIKIIAQKNWFTRHEADRFLNNHCQECVRVYLSIHDCLSFLPNRIIYCQIFCDLLLKSAFERNFNVMQLILVKIK